MSQEQAGAFSRQCLEALKSLAKALGQMALYKIGHPSVAATLGLAEQQLGEAIGQAQGEVVFSIDQDKWLANGRIIGVLGQTPTVIQAFFIRYKVGSLSFKAGLTSAELAAFCELAGLRGDSPQAADPKGFLAERGVSHVGFSEAVYAKVGASAASPEAQACEALLKRITEVNTIEVAIEALVGQSVPDAATRAQVYEKVMELLAGDIQRRVDEVTKTLQQEKNLLQNEQTRTQSVLSNMADGVVVVDEQGKILMMNPAAEQVYGATLAEVAGKPLAEKAKEEHLVTLAAEINAPNDRPIKAEVAVAGGPEDTRRTLKSSGVVVQNEAGKVVGMVSSLSDAAKHKSLQKMQRDFVAHVTHELRAPLSSIRAALEILQGQFLGKVKDEEERMLNTALKNSDRLAELINSILDFSKIESGQMTVHAKQTSPERIAREAVESLSPWAAKKRVGLSLFAAPGLAPVSADSSRTVQVLVNLLSNAIKFTPVGGQITVKVGPSAAEGERFVEFSVKDTGCGIPKADQKRVFEKFVQIAAGEMHVGGTGLGLSIAKALVHLQGGKMWLDSEEGKGSTFSFTLPVYVAPREPAAEAPPPPSPRPWWKKLLGLQ